MGTQLAASGYSVHTLGQGDDGQVERNDITTALERAAQEECELLLVYFTGHGVHVGDTDYLVPGDALAPARGQQWSKAQLDSLLPVDMTSYLAGCKAESVVYIVDACRDSAPDDDSAGFGATTVRAPSKRLALLVGCDREERCQFDATGSHFTRALAEALDPYAPQRTLETVFRQAKERTTDYARRTGEQHPQVSYAPGDEPASAFPELCEGTEIPLRWREDVEKAPLWISGPGVEGPDSPMRERIAEFARECAVSVLKDRRRFDDPWNDPGLPTRTVRRVMPELLHGGTDRSPVETGLLVALPFLREAMWARKLSRLSEADPLNLDPVRHDENRSKMRNELQYVHESHPQLLRKARGHGRRGESEAHRALAAWLAHRWVAEQLVDAPDSGGLELIGRLARALLGPGQDHQEQLDEVRWLLAKSIRFLADDPVDLASYNPYLADAPTALTTAEERCPVRLWSVLGLVRLAGLLAADIRQFPDVLPDHVGVADPVRPADVVRTLHDQLEWANEGNDLHLKMLCPHPALHEGLTDLALRADTVLRALHTAREQQRGDFPDRLPGRVTTRDLLPARRPQSEERVYSAPLLRFALAQDEIRELLMGHQLYGDRSLAVRELYQNAADACRYRELRWEYLRRKGGAPSKWTAEIRITQGREPSVDGRPGRAYIECRDNGVGMGRAQLEQTFSRAGRRFSQTRAFRQEQARWLEEAPELQLYPYSRFGIGVLSYFMIADEVTLVTREVDAEGSIAQQALIVDISSSSGLFRIRRYEDKDGGDPIRDGGTLVRLMLSEPEGNEGLVSALDVLRHQVRLNEHELVLCEEGGEPVVWPAGELRHPAPRDEPRFVPPLDAQGHVWWVPNTGMVLADGIVTSQEPFGYVINLTGPHAPQLSVNRNSLLGWDREWATEEVRRAVADLAGWEGLDLQWLWSLEEDKDSLARTVAAELAGSGLTLPVRRISAHHQPDVSLDSVGWFPDDGSLLPPEPGTSAPGGTDLTESWRLAVLRDQGIRFVDDVGRTVVLPENVTGHPVPRPGDNKLLDNMTSDIRDLATYTRAYDRTLAEALRDLRRFAILGPRLEIPPVAADDTPALDFVPESVDLELLTWMREWAEPGRAQWQPAAGALFSISADSGQSIGALLERCRQYAPLGLTVPEVPVADIAAHVATSREAELLAGWTENERHNSVDGLPVHVLPVHIARLAERLALTSAEVLAQLRPWEFLGYRLPSEDQLLAAAPSSDQWEMFSRFWDPSKDLRTPTLQSLLAEAARRKITVNALLQSVGDLAAQAGMRLPDLSPGPAEARPLEESDLKLLTIDGSTRSPLPTQSIPIDVLALCYAPGGRVPGLGADLDYEPWDAFVSRLRRLEELGMGVPDDLEPLRHWLDLSPRDRIALLISSLDPGVPWTAATLVCAAGELGESLGDSLRRLTTHGPKLRKKSPALSPAALDLTPGDGGSALLTELSGIETGEPFRAVWNDITPFRLAEYSHQAKLTIDEALDQLAPYRALGAPIPELTDAQRASVTGLVPDKHDLLALSAYMALKQPRASSPIRPLELVAIAARLGRTVQRVHERLSRYEPLGVVLDVPDAPDTLPLWQDLVLLSEGLNGQEPALHGTVSAAQVASLARELDTDSAWVTERLRVYAAMFQLDVAETEAADASNAPQEQAT